MIISRLLKCFKKDEMYELYRKEKARAAYWQDQYNMAEKILAKLELRVIQLERARDEIYNKR